MKLLIISDLGHFGAIESPICGWDAVAGEIEALAEIFSEVRVIGTHSGQAPPRTARPYRERRISLAPVPPAGGPHWRDKAAALSTLAVYQRVIRNELPDADAVCLRGPSNVCLAALPLLSGSRRPPLIWAKYGGNWRPDKHESRSHKMQRLWLRHGLGRMPVLVCGDFAGEPARVHGIYNPSFSAADWSEAGLASRHKTLGCEMRLLFAGRLEPHKGARRAIEAVEILRDRGRQVLLDIAGDGSEVADLRALARDRRLPVFFRGWLPREAMKQLYADAHALLLPTETEGWPKVISEAMAWRTVPVAAAVSSIPSTLEKHGAGLTAPPRDAAAFADAVESLIDKRSRWKIAADNAQQAAQKFTYEAYLERLREVLGLPDAALSRKAA